jgi:hypothetical protein
VVMSQAFGHPAFPVDTHIHRLAARWGLSNGSTVERTERDPQTALPARVVEPPALCRSSISGASTARRAGTTSAAARSVRGRPPRRGRRLNGDHASPAAPDADAREALPK